MTLESEAYNAANSLPTAQVIEYSKAVSLKRMADALDELAQETLLKSRLYNIRKHSTSTEVCDIITTLLEGRE
jgi:hypothetical protein